MRRITLTPAPMMLLVALAPAYGQNLWTHPDLTLADPGPGGAAVKAEGVACKLGQVFHGRCRVRTRDLSGGEARLGIKFDTGEPGGRASKVLGWGVAPADRTHRSASPDSVELEVVGAVPEGATRALLHIILDGNEKAGATARFEGVTFLRLERAALPSLWPWGSSTTLPDAEDGGGKVKAVGLPCQFGQVFHGRCRVRTQDIGNGHARLGIKFDTGEPGGVATPELGVAAASGPGRSDRSSSPDWVELEVVGTVPEGATRALPHIILEGEHGPDARAHFKEVDFHLLPPADPANLWVYGSSTTLTTPGDRGSAVQAKGFLDVQPGELFTGQCLVRTAGLSTGRAKIGIKFDHGDGSDPVVPDQAMGPELPDHTRANGAVRLGVQGRVPQGATRALVYVIVEDEANPGAQATFEQVTIHRLPAGAPLRENVWPHGPAVSLTDPGHGRLGILDRASVDCKGGEWFAGECRARTEWLEGRVELGIRFDDGQGTEEKYAVSRRADASPGWVLLKVQGRVPQGASRARMYLLAKGSPIPGAQAHFDQVAFRLIDGPQGAWPEAPPAAGGESQGAVPEAPPEPEAPAAGIVQRPRRGSPSSPEAQELGGQQRREAERRAGLDQALRRWRTAVEDEEAEEDGWNDLDDKAGSYPERSAPSCDPSAVGAPRLPTLRISSPNSSWQAPDPSGDPGQAPEPSGRTGAAARAGNGPERPLDEGGHARQEPGLLGAAAAAARPPVPDSKADSQASPGPAPRPSAQTAAAAGSGITPWGSMRRVSPALYERLNSNSRQ